MVRALVAGLVWLAVTGALSLVIARAMRRADLREESEEWEARAAVPSTPAPGSLPRGGGCALTRPPPRSRAPASRGRRPRGT